MKKRIILGVMLAGCILSVTGRTYASELNISNKSLDVSESQYFTSDVIVEKYRLYKGKLQYRRWNETKRYWVDSEWIDVP